MGLLAAGFGAAGTAEAATVRVGDNWFSPKELTVEQHSIVTWRFVGDRTHRIKVTSGPDRIFSSRDCQAKSEDLVKIIGPGASETANFPWSRNRSIEGCQPVEAKPGGGGAYYIFTAKLGSRASPEAVFQLN